MNEKDSNDQVNQILEDEKIANAECFKPLIEKMFSLLKEVGSDVEKKAILSAAIGKTASYLFAATAAEYASETWREDVYQIFLNVIIGMVNVFNLANKKEDDKGTIHDILIWALEKSSEEAKNITYH